MKSQQAVNLSRCQITSRAISEGRARCSHRADCNPAGATRRGVPTMPYLVSIRCFTLLILLGFWISDFGLWTSSAAQNTNGAPGRPDYSNFEIIPKKNIFNPRRSPAYVPRERTPTVYRKTPESFALVGVMSYGKGPMAFFDGTRSDYKKVLKPNDSIGGFKVTAIDDSSVKLASSTNEIEVQVGMQLAREEGGDWKLSVRPESLDTGLARDRPMRSAGEVNSERASADSNQNGNNPFGAIGNFFANGGFPGGGFPAGGFNNPTPTAQPVAAPTTTQPAAPSDPSDILARLAARRAQENGDPNQPGGEQPSNPGGQSPPNPRGQLPPTQQPGAPSDEPPNPRGEPPPNQ